MRYSESSAWENKRKRLSGDGYRITGEIYIDKRQKKNKYRKDGK